MARRHSSARNSRLRRPRASPVAPASSTATHSKFTATASGWGIDAPESSQLCRDDDSKHFRCGAKAANSLADFIGNRPVSCIEVERDRYDRSVAVCTVDNIDLADWLVRNGLAFDWPRYSKNAYAEAQRQAEQNERGLWTGSFSMPWQFRACVRKGGRASKCSDESP